MKNPTTLMNTKLNTLQIAFTLVFFLCSYTLLISQEEAVKKDVRPVRSTFESVWILNNQSVMVPIKGTFEFDMQHRFGTWNNKYEDVFGIFAPSNIRLGVNYVLLNNLSLGLGLNKFNKTWDLNAKYAIIQQTRSGNIPIGITYFANMAIDSRDKDKIERDIRRFSYFHQLIIARKINSKLSIQLAPSFSHFNYVEGFINDQNEAEKYLNNDHFALSAAARYKISGPFSILINYDQPLTNHPYEEKSPKPNLGFGIEITSSAHAFQIFAGNYSFITPQRNNLYNQNDLTNGEFLIGFNITRLWNF